AYEIFHVTGVQTCALPIYILLGAKLQKVARLGERSGRDDRLAVGGDGGVLKDVHGARRPSIALDAGFRDRVQKVLITVGVVVKRSEERRVGNEIGSAMWKR